MFVKHRIDKIKLYESISVSRYALFRPEFERIPQPKRKKKYKTRRCILQAMSSTSRCPTEGIASIPSHLGVTGTPSINELRHPLLLGCLVNLVTSSIYYPRTAIAAISNRRVSEVWRNIEIGLKNIINRRQTTRWQT